MDSILEKVRLYSIHVENYDILLLEKKSPVIESTKFRKYSPEREQSVSGRGRSRGTRGRGLQGMGGRMNISISEEGERNKPSFPFA